LDVAENVQQMTRHMKHEQPVKLVQLRGNIQVENPQKLKVQVEKKHKTTKFPLLHFIFKKA